MNKNPFAWMSLRLFGTDIHPCPVLQLLNTLLDAKITWYLIVMMWVVLCLQSVSDGPQHMSSPDEDFDPY